MSIFGKTITLLFLAAMLASCSSFRSTPALSEAEIMETAIATVSTGLAGTQGALATNTPMALATLPLPTALALQALPTLSFPATASTPHPLRASPTPWPTIPTYTPLAFSDPSIPLGERIVYYYFVSPAEDPVPEGTVFSAGHPLAPAYADQAYTSDTAADLRTALEIVLNDGRNIWRGGDLEIVEATFGNGHANIVLQGEYFAAGGGPLWAAGRQILMTVFANPSVRTASISVNGGAVTNMGISNSREALPGDYVYTRAGIGPPMNEQANATPDHDSEDVDPPSPYEEQTVRIGQVLVFPDFSLAVLEPDVREGQKFANFHFIGYPANTGMVGEGETYFRELSQLGGTSADDFSPGDGLIVAVSSITDQGITVQFTPHRAREVELSGLTPAHYSLYPGDILRLPFGSLQVIKVTNAGTGEALFIPDGSQAGSLIRLEQGLPVDHPELSDVEIRPLQILPEGIFLQASLR
ncbi:MAG TPA: hypothetical protein VFY26_03420 [Anaerolineales bacterium]|nr:hypothetical protein [Anaerolineales bacterium]